jgi:prepilin-type N-terminal cleavage/methylation domain-containing protein
MKTKKNDMWRVTSDTVNGAASGTGSIRNFAAFTLIELLVVISIIALLAGFTIPVLSRLKQRELIIKTQGEMAQLVTAIDSYKAAYGIYPPGGTNCLANPLYFELLGTTNNSGTFFTLDNSASILASKTMANFGVGGFVNCAKGSGEDAAAAKNFLPDLRLGQYGTNNTSVAGPYVNFLVGSVGGPDDKFNPYTYAGVPVPNFNPWRYVSPGTNNPASYDLWIELSINGTTNLICNWSKEVQKNINLP